jgi:hypothetical protein
MADQIAQPPPAFRLGAVDGVAHSGRAETEERLGRLAIVPGDQRNRGDRGEFAHEARDAGERLTVAAMNGDDHGIHAPAPRDGQRFAQRIRMQRIEATVTRGIEAGTFWWGKNCAHGYHAQSW